MLPKVWESLLNATEQLQSCDSNGTTRGVVTDAYSAIDSAWSAMFHQAGEEPPRNHRKKLDLAFRMVSSELLTKEISFEDIESLYKQWLVVRYSQQQVSPSQAYRRRMEAHAVFSSALSVVAKAESASVGELEERLYLDLFGERYQAYQEAIGVVHEEHQFRAQRNAEMGYGTSLGNKLVDPSNYCEFSLVSNDAITREMLAKEGVLNNEAVELYEIFLRTVDKLQEARVQRGILPNEIPNFTIGLRIRYAGASVDELGERWGKAIGNALNSFIERSREEPI